MSTDLLIYVSGFSLFLARPRLLCRRHAYAGRSGLWSRIAVVAPLWFLYFSVAVAYFSFSIIIVFCNLLCLILVSLSFFFIAANK